MKLLCSTALSLFLSSAAWALNDADRSRLASELEGVMTPAEQATCNGLGRALADFVRMSEQGGAQVAELKGLPEETAYLKSHGFLVVRQVRSTAAVPHLFKLATEAMKRQDQARSALWCGTIAAICQDAVAIDNDPRIAYFRDYTLAEGVSRTFGGKPLPLNQLVDASFTDVAASERGAKEVAAFVRRAAALKPACESPDELAVFIGERMFKLGQAGRFHSDKYFENSRRALLSDKPLANNGEIALARGQLLALETALEMIRTAQHFAAKKIVFDPDALAAKIATGNELWKSFPLEDGPAWTEVLKSADPKARTGLLVEADWPLQQSLLGQGSRVLGPAVARHLAAKGGFRAVDLRNAVAGSLPDPAEMPVLVIIATSLSKELQGWKRNDLIDALEQWRAKGGRILWIGGDRVKCLDRISGVLGGSGGRNPAEILREGVKSGQETLKLAGKIPEKGLSLGEAALIRPDKGVVLLATTADGKAGLAAAVGYINSPLLGPGIFTAEVQDLDPTLDPAAAAILEATLAEIRK
jgi:hypothetical protein